MDGIAAETMNRVAKAAEKMERLEPRLLAARGELYATIRDAHAEGATFATIARVAGPFARVGAADRQRALGVPIRRQGRSPGRMVALFSPPQSPLSRVWRMVESG
jgi:hypothetical protein